MKSDLLKLAFITPYLSGDRLAEIIRLTSGNRFKTVIYTTKYESFDSFMGSVNSDHYNSETVQINTENITVYRFPAANCTHQFRALTDKLNSLDYYPEIPGLSPLIIEEEEIYSAENLNSKQLTDQILKEYEDYDILFFCNPVHPLSLNVMKKLPKTAESVLISDHDSDLSDALLHTSLSEPLRVPLHAQYLKSTAETYYMASQILFFSEISQEETLSIMGPGIYLKSYTIKKNYEDPIINILSSDSDADEIHKRMQSGRKVAQSENNIRIHQLLPTLSSGDAISNQVIYLKNLIRSMGYKSEIYVENRESAVASHCEYYRQVRLNPDDILLYHHSIGTSLTQEVVSHPGPKMLIYHNITPPEFYKNFNPKFARILREGIEDLPELAKSFEFCAGVSQYNLADLYRYGFKKGEVLPIIVDPGRWNQFPDQEIMHNLTDGRINIIFVGRLSPNKRQEDIIDIFYNLKVRFPSARLFLVGDGAGQAHYVESLYERIWKYQSGENVFITGKVTESQLHAYYRSAHLFISMSEHEGFGVPLVEAMWFDIPVLALASSAVAETMGEGGILIEEKGHPQFIADMAAVILESPDLRRDIILNQQKNRMRFIPHNIRYKYRQSINRLIEKFKTTEKNVFS
jgi:glycosyltransferase involved in cell wall biosynthesis